MPPPSSDPAHAAFRSRYGPWALVAGASEGLGRQFALQVGERGLNLLLVARREEPLQATAEEVRRLHGVEVRTASLDLGADGLLERIAPAIQGLEIGLLIYNAALSIPARFLERPAEDHARTLAVNCRGPLLLSHALGREMAARGRGGILLMSSAAGLAGSGLIATYAASKAFDTAFGEGLAQDLEPEGIDVLSFVASATRTPNLERDLQGRRPSVPMADPAVVVRQALRELGRRRTAIAGTGTRMLLPVLVRVLSRRRFADLMTRATYGMYGMKPPRRKRGA